MATSVGREQRDTLARAVSLESRENNRKNLVSYKEKPVAAAAAVCLWCGVCVVYM